MTIDQCVVKRILVDTSSSVNVIFKDTFKQMDIPWDKVIPYATPLVGFTGQTVKYDGKISLPISISDTSLIMEFLLISASSPYNCIMGRQVLNQLQAKVSSCDLSMEVPMGKKAK